MKFFTKNIKPHFWYTKAQRNGVLFLLVIIVGLQFVYVFLDDFIPVKDNNSIENLHIQALQLKIDSLKKAKQVEKTKLYPFNPNFITDYKGYRLGMSVDEIDRLHEFRKTNSYVNSKQEFQEVTKVSDSLLNRMAPYFKFPDWVVKKQKKQNRVESKELVSEGFSTYSKKEVSTNHINSATADDFRIIKGIGEKRSQQIVKYRDRLKGFSFDYQLYEVWGLPPEVILDLLSVFEIKQKPVIEKVNVNTAEFKEVLATPYVDYDLCKKIFDYRDEVAELQDIKELRNIKDFPQNKYDRIVLYLKAE